MLVFQAVRTHAVHYSQYISVNRESTQNNNDDFPDPWSPPPDPSHLDSGSEVSFSACVRALFCVYQYVFVCEYTITCTVDIS